MMEKKTYNVPSELVDVIKSINDIIEKKIEVVEDEIDHLTSNVVEDSITFNTAKKWVEDVNYLEGTKACLRDCLRYLEGTISSSRSLDFASLAKLIRILERISYNEKNPVTISVVDPPEDEDDDEW